ncbi:pyrimidine 5'-nucleotidase [Hyphobacterium marinum]|uniref:Pyrimidine 5'-nucleotidase n=1 Tax=Hyphobacterium marinum TaxID=3116574 RepID=A0ABU7LWH5_9PROT|nr:pyrimidine 5'-nucleotidase [Hyphobacterium sp. Y6023]MEE2565831.1 pyrimidine 5'-nucleotidase [Hyphobacterium sp. Y6023]
MSAPETGPDLSHVTTWVFDLDHTLYPSDAAIMSQVDARMTDYVARTLRLPRDEARIVQKTYWREHGTTLNGLMANNQIGDGREFLDFVHDIDLDVIDPDPVLADRIRALPGKRYVYTNGSMKHAENVCGRLGLSDCFDDLFDVEAAGFQPKPLMAGFERFSSRFAIRPAEASFFEDSVRNLKTAHELGWTTILIRAKPGPRDEESAGPGEHPDHVHFAADCLKTFLGEARTASGIRR